MVIKPIRSARDWDVTLNAALDALDAANTALITSLAPVATSGSATDLSTGTLNVARFPDLSGTYVRAAVTKELHSIAPGMSIVGDKTSGNQFLSSDGVVTDMMAEFSHYILRDCYDLCFVYANMSTQGNADGLNQPGNGWSPITVNAALASQHLAAGATRYQVTFGGKSSVTIDPSGYVISDPVSINFAAGSTWWERVHVTVASGGKWPTGTGANYLETGTVANDKTLAGDCTGGGNKAYGAVAVIARNTRTGLLGLIILGDSWNSSGADWGSSASSGFPNVNLARTGESVSSSTPQVLRRRLPFVSLGTHVEHAYGINDFQTWSAGTSFDLPAHKARYIAQWRSFLQRGLLVYQWTCTPKTSSTDAWVTTANQTVNMPNASVETARTAWNDWLRDGAPIDSTSFVAAAIGSVAAGVIRMGSVGHPLVNIVEIADLAETSRNSGIFKAGKTSDGVHPNPSGNIDLSAFRLNYWQGVQTAYAAANA